MENEALSRSKENGSFREHAYKQKVP